MEGNFKVLVKLPFCVSINFNYIMCRNRPQHRLQSNDIDDSHRLTYSVTLTFTYLNAATVSKTPYYYYHILKTDKGAMPGH